ncbi:hypothetical protein ADL22_17760 [Streptomyces sp. NRRL F-4489]|uniref:VanZ family protein n=1 Tax=Streptomyces sp. NRRL F-4489 TaxID=1609095 RepID=UPI00074B2B80|nr:VanZ family protein [Streptomyces sp. NRRL F-4489]KUL38617.1 hypothetical protein ADL22_17760 [Streptomyces sp. NRRL F-4489]
MSPEAHALVMAAWCAVMLLAALALWRPLTRRLGRRSAPALLFLLTLALCAGITLPDQIQPGALTRLHQCVVEGGAGPRTLGAGPGHQLVNVVLWIPLALCGVLATRRALLVPLGISATWAGIELLQTLDPVRDCQPADWAHNTLGAALGALLGWALLRAARARSRTALR